MTKLELTQFDDISGWQHLLTRSPQGTRFLDPAVLDLFGQDYRLYGVVRGGVAIMGLPVLDGAPLPWCYRQGPIFLDEIWNAAPAKRIQYEIELAEFAVTELAKVEPRFRLTLSPQLTDVRGYDWVHYHDAALPRCSILPRYTAIVPLDGADTARLRAGARSARRQEERYATEREGLRATNDGTVDELFALYQTTFAQQGAAVEGAEAALFAPYVTHFLQAGCGHILMVRNDSGDAVAGAFVFGDHDGVWHVPIVGTGQTRYGGTLLYFHILDHALNHGAGAVDFDGANSPKRGYFKHSIGARPTLYFEVRYDAGR